VSIYYIAFAAFNVWMLIDALRRRAAFYWYLIILLVPFGGVIYFALVKVRDYGLGGRALPKKTSGNLNALRERFEQTPSLANQLELADALEVAEQYDEAAALYRGVLAREQNEKRALHGLARCELSAERPAEAVKHLHALLEQDNAYRDYSAALDYAEALWQNGQREDAIDVLTGLTSVSTRMNHHVALAHYLILDERYERARQALKAGLSHYAGAPDFVKRRDLNWAKQGENMLAKLPTDATPAEEPQA
jgi:hypothetical protein